MARSLFAAATALALLATAPALAQGGDANGNAGAPNSATPGGAMQNRSAPAGRDAGAPGAAPTVGAATPNAAPGVGNSSAGMATANSASSHNPVLTADDNIRASMVVGASVYNDKEEKLGTVNDILLDKTHRASEVVLSVGGVLGVGGKLVTVPFDKLHFPNAVNADNARVMLPGMTSDALTGLPTFHYAAQ